MAIRQGLGQDKFRTILVTLTVAIFSYIISNNIVKKSTIYGVKLATNNIKQLATKALATVFSGTLFLVLTDGISGVTAAIIANDLLFNSARMYIEFNCHNFVSEVQVEQYHKQKAVFLDQYKAIEPRIYVRDDKMGTKIFIPNLKEAPNCDLIEELGDVQAISNNVDNNKNASSEASGQMNIAPIRKSQRVVS